MVVLEGPDGGGKSTLAELLTQILGYNHLRSEGPEKYPGEINDRIRRYQRLYGDSHNVIFDRHPCVSQFAYSLVHQQSTPDEELVSRFYYDRPLFIYCRPDPDLVVHTATGEWDTPEYLKSVDENYTKLLAWYDEWALKNAHYIYRIGHSIRPIEELIKVWRRI